ncbi:unnamed protein product [Vitrella brassicaformis CCMP3155]|uniref:Pre-mRNA-splicing factor Syf1/CRNKL1-like C-terminal HAT-repeats domain-containing protein n=2 Tax=Vitrella brassicaformis TaxID=1169539 RepID=A0A0G4FP34_VITBC|nr:unnamed protein product [Vitrella brassicaformis CCMP3155]|eukprot:CEM15963.1 unnamed protein product [Vitrella brassicaformis CCMP3155]
MSSGEWQAKPVLLLLLLTHIALIICCGVGSQSKDVSMTVKRTHQMTGFVAPVGGAERRRRAKHGGLTVLRSQATVRRLKDSQATAAPHHTPSPPSPPSPAPPRYHHPVNDTSTTSIRQDPVPPPIPPPSPSAPLSSTELEELSQKVEAALNEKYTIMIPGPGAGGPPARPLAMNLDLWHWRADALIKERRKDKVTLGVRILRHCISRDPLDPRAWLILANYEITAKNITGARWLLDEGVRNCRRSVDVHVAAGRFAQRFDKDYRKAVDLFKRASEIDPKATLPVLELANLQFNLRNYDSARRVLLGALQLDARHGRAYEMLGRLERERGQPAEAVRWFTEGTRVDSDNIALWQGLALAHEALGHVDEARDVMRQATSMPSFSNNSWLYQTWGSLESRHGDPVRAEQLFDRALKLDPTRGAAWHSWAKLCEQLGEYGRARMLYSHGVEAIPANQLLWLSWGELEASLGDNDKARSLYSSALSRNPRGPKSAQLWCSLGKLEGAVGNATRARECFATSRQVAYRAVDQALCTLAWAQFEAAMRNPPKARQLFEEALTAQRSLKSIWESYALFEELLGNVGRAIELRQRATSALRRDADSPANSLALQWLKTRGDTTVVDPQQEPIGTLLDQAGDFFRKLLTPPSAKPGGASGTTVNLMAGEMGPQQQQHQQQPFYPAVPLSPPQQVVRQRARQRRARRASREVRMMAEYVRTRSQQQTPTAQEKNTQSCSNEVVVVDYRGGLGSGSGVERRPQRQQTGGRVSANGAVLVREGAGAPSSKKTETHRQEEVADGA